MKITNSKIAAIILLVCGFNLIAVAQTYNENVTVVAPFDPAIQEITKINFTPSTSDTVLNKNDMQYHILSRKVATDYELDQIKPAKVAGEPISKLFPFYVKGGIGNYATPYAELYYSNTRSKDYAYGARYKFQSSSAYIKDYKSVPTNNSTNQFEIFGKKFFKKATLSSSLYWEREVVNCYGMNDDSVAVYTNNVSSEYKDGARRIYNALGARVDLLSNNVEPDDWFYRVFANYEHYKLKFGNGDFYNNSSDFNIGANVKKSIEALDQYDMKLSIGAKATYDYATLATFDKNFLLKIMPYAELDWKVFKVAGGFKINVAGDTITDLFFNPFLEVRAMPVENVLTLYMGIDGDVETNTLHSISKVNPFLDRASQLYQTRNKFSFYAGMLTSVSKTIDINLSGCTKSLEDAVNFTQALNGMYNDFLYTFEDYQMTNLSAEIVYHKAEKLRLSLKGDYFIYNEDLLYKPDFQLTFMARYLIADKFALQTELFAFSKMDAKNRHNELETLKGSVDWSVSMEYFYTKRLSFFLDVNNLLAQRYFTWYDYPSYRFNFLIGATYSF